MDFPNLFIESLAIQRIRYHVSTKNVRKDIAMLRKERHEKLIGKYVIVCDGVSSKKLVYYQDPKIDRNRFWTEFITNAKAYDSEKGALRDLGSIYLNNPRIVRVESRNEMVIVYEKNDEN